MPAGSGLDRALTEAQHLGFLGDRNLAEVIAHARGFADELDGLPASRGDTQVVDLGAGGGIPGLVIAEERPDLQLTLVDRRLKRTDFLQRVVRRLGWEERVSIVCADVEVLVRTRRHHFHAVVARGFGPPEWTLRVAREFVVPTGRIVISEPPHGDRWDPDLMLELRLRHRDVPQPGGRLAVFDGFT